MANLRVDKITSTETFEKTGSVQFDGSNDDLSVGSAGDFNYLHNGAASFTAEFWVYPQLVNSRQAIFSTGGNSSSTGFCVRIMASGDYGSSNGYLVGAQTSKSSGGNYLYWDSESTRLDANTWYHIATVYDHTDNTLKIYVDGKLTNSGFSKTYGTFGSHSTSNSTYALNVGQEPYGNTMHLKGHLSNLRILNGVKLYTSNFKPPMRELEVITGTTLLTCQSKTSVTLDASGSHTITSNGAPPPSELTPGILTPVVKSGGGSAITGSVEFDGSTDYITLPVTTDFTFGTNDFTIEFWLNPGENASNYTILLALSSSTPSDRFEVAYHSSTIRVYTDTATWRDTGITPSKGDWHHIAFVRNYSGNSLIMYLNGVNRWEVTNTRDYDELFTDAKIGSYASSSYGYLQGFISNFRINKNTALYTDDFIPPTRELKKVPGTVLLCCQDPDDPFTEATGKTLGGGGNFQRSNGIEYITNGSFVGGYTTEWEAKNSANITHSNNTVSVTSTQNYSGIRVKSAYLPTLVAGRKYAMTVDIVSITNPIRFGVVSGNTLSDISTAGKHTLVFAAGASTTEIYIEKPSGSNSTFVLDSVSIKEIDGSHPSSNFTPQVGDDRQVTFEGVAKINTDAYFYLPTGDTESRDNGAGTRGVFVRGQSDTPSPTLVETIEYINISSTGNAINFGDAAVQSGTAGACSSSTRGLQGGGSIDGGTTADILRFTIASTGTAVDSGADLLSAGSYIEALSSSTRAVFVGGSPPGSNVLQFTEIQSLGNTVDFGNLNNNVFGEGTCCDGVRGVIFGGTTGPSPGDRIDNIDYIIVSSKGNAQDFGNLGAARAQGSGFSNKIRGIYAGGRYQPQNNIIEYVTIATTGNANDFGDLISQASRDGGGTCSSTRGVHAGGDANPSPTADVNTIQYITIMSMGNALDFGDLTERKTHMGACSNGHGGLG